MSKKILSFPETRQSAREYFYVNGISMKAWADERGFPYGLVKDVMLGRLKGNRGTAHHVAVALGLKPNLNAVSKEA